MCFRFYLTKREFGVSDDTAAEELVRGSHQIACLMKLNRFRHCFMRPFPVWKSSLGVKKKPISRMSWTQFDLSI